MIPVPRFFPFVFALAWIASSPALAATPLACEDGFRSAQEIAQIETFRDELATNAALRASDLAASHAASDALIEAFNGADLGDAEKNLIQNAKTLVENPIFDEALARSFSVGGMKKGETILEFQARLRLAPPEQQIAFAELVLSRYNQLLDKAVEWADEDRFALIAKRWGLDERQTYDLLVSWSASEATDRAAIRIATLAWTKAVDSESLVKAIRELRRAPRSMRITEAEDVLLTRIRQPHYDADLARNEGPISDAAFRRRLRMWNVLGWAQQKLNIVRYPKEATFVIALSVAPVTLIHLLGKDWNLTNTVATIIGGVATCPPLIVALTKRAAVRNHEAILLDILTVRQLSELGRWIKAHPKRAAEVGFQGLEKPLENRIAKLREIRYSKTP